MRSATSTLAVGLRLFENKYKICLIIFKPVKTCIKRHYKPCPEILLPTTHSRDIKVFNDMPRLKVTEPIQHITEVLLAKRVMLFAITLK